MPFCASGQVFPAPKVDIEGAVDLIVQRPEGLYCPPGDFYIDPWKPVDRAVITHAHADHARAGHHHYLAAAPAKHVLLGRLGAVDLQCVNYGEPVHINGVRLSLHPAGHVLGSAQVRLEQGGHVWVASGDYKLEPEPTCAAFEAVRCDTFITESTFGLPIYRWPPQAQVFAGINAWWRANAAQGLASILYCYSFGKAQRVAAGVDASIGPIICHGATQALMHAYRESSVALPQTRLVAEVDDQALLKRALVLAPPSTAGSAWLKRFGDRKDAFASGWMALRGARRRRAVDRGFVLSDHADWPSLHRAIAATGAQQVIVTHGYVSVMVRHLQEQGLMARSFETEFGGDDDEVQTPPSNAPAAKDAKA